MLKIYQRRTNDIIHGVSGVLSSYAGLNLNDSVTVLAAAKQLIRSCD